MKYITFHNLAKLLDALKEDYRVFVPVKKSESGDYPIKKGAQRFYKEYDKFSDDIIIGEVRPFEPLKAFFVSAREKVADNFSPEVPHTKDKPFALVGVKNCDLKQGFKVQDHVFNNHDFQDPFYIKNREENLIIAADCTCAIDTCFCLATGNQPYPEENFDINLSSVGDGFIVEAAPTRRAQKFMDKYHSLFDIAKDYQLNERKEQRQKVIKKVEENIKENNIPSYDTLKEDIIKKNWDSDVWLDESKTCVECAACTIICPTCHCFLLYDQKDKEKMERLRIWDSCMIKDYARVAGGANPRPKLWMRLRNRFEKKFDFFPKVGGFYACTGCGRCISACPAMIDIREVLVRLVKGNGKNK
ncbi:MAG: 4Fe-4S dicluster domain-containing protein [Candidatus Omnitrophota bacterium]|nr:MAG: 4Fe-4S dicluster domain-containing protein [Candidatus Omnitrophota bacterium]